MGADLPRRRLFIGLGAAALAPTLSLCPALSANYDRLSELRAMLLACGNQAAIETLGRACLLQGLPDASMRSIAKRVEEFRRASGAEVDFAEWYDAETTSDFDAGRVVRVQG